MLLTGSIAKLEKDQDHNCQRLMEWAQEIDNIQEKYYRSAN